MRDTINSSSENLLTYEFVYSLGFEYLEGSYGFAELKITDKISLRFIRRSEDDIVVYLNHYYPMPNYETKKCVTTTYLNIKTEQELTLFIKFLTK